MKMCEAFSKIGHEVILFGIKTKEIDEKQIFEYYGINKTFKLCLNQMAEFRGFPIIHSIIIALRVLTLDKIKAYYSRSIFISFLMSFFVNSFYECHSLEYKRHNRLIQGRIFKSRKVKKIICISESLKNDIIKAYRISADKIIVLPDGADPYLKQSKNRLKGFNAGYSGSLLKGRGIDLILNMAKKFPDVNFHIMGGSESEITYWRNKMDAPNIKYYGHIPPKSVKDIIIGMDVLLMPYQSCENRPLIDAAKVNTVKWMSPMKMFEYMATGKAIISSDLMVLKEVLKNEHNALLCDPDRKEDWYAALRRLKNDQALRTAIGAKAKSDLEAHYTWKIRAEKLIRHII
jgi:glycosyltransferase involved in cell wall biosynthesis